MTTDGKMQRDHRADNFGAGPAALPLPVLERVMAQGMSYGDSGMSVFEMSHRSRWYDEIQAAAESRMRQILGISDEYAVLFLQGGASLQFAMLPMNFADTNQQLGYVVTGSFAKKAYAEARKVGRTTVVATSEADGFRSLPKIQPDEVASDLAYVHFTSNNTIYGTQWPSWPEGLPVPMVADMSSDILSRPLDVDRFHLIYAGAQKNLGVAGLTVVIVRKDWALEHAPETLPTILSYKTHIEGDSRYNTPPVFAIYVLSELLRWVLELGGLTAMEERNRAKADVLYRFLDARDRFYEGVAAPDARSQMNVTFRLRDKDLESAFLSEAKSAGFVGVSGHRSVGGCRISLYNAIDLAQVQRLADFMDNFAAAH